ncbi:MAG: FAD-dependent tricarballylate dehydrogenase TcuA [Pseudomonadota bacterium]
MQWDVVIVGSGNAGLAAGIAACEAGKRTLIVEKASANLAGGNTKYTAGAMRFAYDRSDELLPLLATPDDPRVAISDFGSYTSEKFADDLRGFNDGEDLTPEQITLVGQSYDAVRWLAGHGVTYEPIYARQSFEKDGKLIFWGGLTLAAEDEGVGLFDMELAAYQRLGGEIRYGAGLAELTTQDGQVTGLRLETGEEITAASTILACGGFEANEEMRADIMGAEWAHARTRGTPMNRGDGLRAAWAVGAQRYGRMTGCHATPMDLYMKPYANLDLPHGERKNYRKISYFLGVMLNAEGQRFVDEGYDFRNYTYAQFGAAVLRQPGHKAWQIFDAKTADLLYAEYRFHDASYVEAETLEDLVLQCEGLDGAAALATLADFNAAVDDATPFDPTIKDGKGTKGLTPAKSNWAQKLDTAPFRAYPVTGGITFTYGGLKISDTGAVLDDADTPIPGLFACGELVGGVFLGGYPGGSGLTSGAVFGRLAGSNA